MDLKPTCVCWLDLGGPPGAQQAFLSRTWGENTMKKIVGQDNNREIAHHLVSWTEKALLGEININYYQLISQ